MELLGYPVTTGGRRAIVDSLRARARGMQVHIITLNPEMLVAAARDSSKEQLLKRADFYVADGVGLSWAARRLKLDRVDRYPGIDLAEDLIASLAQDGGSVYLLGSKEGIAEKAAGRLTSIYPGLKIAGTSSGYFADNEEPQVVKSIAQGKPDLLLAGMGFPRQEGFISANRDELGAPMLMGVGGALEVLAGVKRRAPRCLQSLGMEWAYRTLIDINRLKRLGVLPAFITLVMRAAPRRNR